MFKSTESKPNSLKASRFPKLVMAMMPYQYKLDIFFVISNELKHNGLQQRILVSKSLSQPTVKTFLNKENISCS